MPKHEIANPLQNLLAQAEGLKKRGGEVSTLKKRLTGTSSRTIILADVSGSMAEQVESGRTKATLLQDALDQVLPEYPDASVIAFNSLPVEIAQRQLPSPEGGTALHLALDNATRFSPRHTIVISDGEPDDETLALESAKVLTGTIDVIYCGPDSNKGAIEFLSKLARVGAGRIIVTTWTRGNGLALQPMLRKLLTA